MVMADSGLLERVLANLIDNALRYAPDSPVRVTAGRVGERVLIAVIDEGPGIPRGTEEQLFAPFQRLGDQDTSIGVGLGLSVAKGFVEAMGGTIQATDTPGGGLTVDVDLAAPPRSPRAMTKVLVVDDEPQILRALRINLSVRGYEVITASPEPMRCARPPRSVPTSSILDLGLPDMSGIDVIGGLRGLADGARDRAVGAHRLRRQGQGARRRRRRLRHQTLRHGRVPGPATRGGAARRRRADTDEPVIETASFTVDLSAKKVTKNGTEVHLTPTEWGMLEMLVRNRGKLVGREELLKEVWGPAYAKETHYLRVYLAQLRRKLEDDPSRPVHLLTEAGMGYRFQQ